MAEPQDPKEPQADAGDEADESRRQFIKRLAYIAPVMETFLLSKAAFGGGDGRRR